MAVHINGSLLSLFGVPFGEATSSTLHPPTVAIGSITKANDDADAEVSVTLSNLDGSGTGIWLFVVASNRIAPPTMVLLGPADTSETVTVPSRRLTYGDTVVALAVTVSSSEISFPHYDTQVFDPGLDPPDAFTASTDPAEGTVGVTFSAVTTPADLGLGVTLSFQWNLDGLAIEGETSASYVATAVGALTVAITATNIAGTTNSTSATVSVLPAPQAPFFSEVPAIAGSTEVGQTLTVTSNGNPTGYPAPTVTVQWQRNGADIPGATGNSYVLVPDDAGQQIGIEVHASNSVGDEFAHSETLTIDIEAQIPAIVTAPTIAGDTFVGGTLIATSEGEWMGHPAPDLTLNWQRDGTDIAGATASSYLVQSDDAGTSLRLRVTATNTSGSVTAYSEAAPIAAAILVLSQNQSQMPNDVFDNAEVQAGDLILAFGFIHNSTTIPALPAGHTSPENGTSSANTSAARFSWRIADATDVGATWVYTGVTRAFMAVVRNFNASNPVTFSGWAVSNDRTPAWPALDAEGSGLTFGLRGIRANVTNNVYPGMVVLQSQGGQNSSLQAAVTGTGATIPLGDLAAYIEPDVGAGSAGAHTALVRINAGFVSDFAPINTSIPTIAGTPVAGQTLTVTSNGGWLGVPSPTFARQWLRNGTAIAGAIGSTYTLQTMDVGTQISLQVTASNSEGDTIATSDSVSVAAAVTVPENTVLPSIIGTGSVGQTLTADQGTWTGSPTFTRQWLNNGSDISGATGTTYLVQSGDAADSISVRITATNAAGSAIATSNSVVIDAASDAPVNTVAPVVASTKIKVWISADGARDSDDNVAIMVGAAQGLKVMSEDGGYELAAVVFGDTKDGAQYRMLHPTGSLPSWITPVDPLFNDTQRNQQGVGNLAFFRKWAEPAFDSLQIATYDLCADDNDGQRPWNFSAGSLGAMAQASQALVADILAAMATDDGKVVYSAGGGANVAAEAIGYLLGQGYTKSQIIPHFAVVQQGGNNWMRQYEPQARTRTVECTISIVTQAFTSYPNGWEGPGLDVTINNPNVINGLLFGTAFDNALDVAIGNRAFGSGLPAGAIFNSDLDGSDCGGHAFAFDRNALLASWDTDRMLTGDNLDEGTSYTINAASGPDRERVLYNSFRHQNVTALFNGTGSALLTSIVNARLASTTPPVAPIKTTGGQTITRSSEGTWTGTPTPTLAQNWQRSGVDISGATGNSYAIQAADAGHNIRLRVRGTNTEGVSDGFSNAIAVSGGNAPVNTVAPSISGSGVVGQQLARETGSWTGSPTPTLETQWQRSGSNIAGQTGSTYTLQSADAGTQVRVRVVGTNTAGSTTAFSPALNIQATSGSWNDVEVNPSNHLSRFAASRAGRTRYRMAPGIYPDFLWPSNVTDFDIEIIPQDRSNPPTIRAISFGRSTRNFRHLSSAPAGSNFTRKIKFDGVNFTAQRFTSATIGGNTLNYVASMASVVNDGQGIGFRTIGTTHPCGNLSGSREAAGYLGLNIESGTEYEIVNCRFDGYSIQIDLGPSVQRIDIHHNDLIAACEDIVKFRGNNVTVRDNYAWARPPSAAITNFTGGPNGRPHGDFIQAMRNWQNLRILRNAIIDPSGHLAGGQIKTGGGNTGQCTQLLMEGNELRTSAQTAWWINNVERGPGIEGWDFLIRGNKHWQYPGVQWLGINAFPNSPESDWGNNGWSRTADARILVDNNVGADLRMNANGITYTRNINVNNGTTWPVGWRDVAPDRVPNGQPYSGRYGDTAGVPTGP